MLLSRVTEFPIHLIRLRLGVSEFPGVSAPSFFQRLLLLTLGRLEKRVSAKLLTSDSGNRIISQKQITNKFKNIYIYTPKNKHQRTSKNRRVNIMKSTHNLQRLRGGYSVGGPPR